MGCSEHRLAVDFETGPPGPHCGRCAARLGRALPDGTLCAACRRRPGRVPRISAVWDYVEGEAAREWILAFKHGPRPDLASPLGWALARRVAVQEAPGALWVPVPTHPLRRLERGFDVTRALTRTAARVAGEAWLPALRRRRFTPPQGAPGAASRAANVREAFAVRPSLAPRVAGRRVVLVDDVATSGATAAACAAPLRAAGAAGIRVAVLARAAPGG